MDTQELIQHYADKFSTNKATNRAYKKIFYLIYKLNVIDKQNNEYGFAEINFNLFKSISKRKYKEILIDLYMNGLIYTNISPKKNNTGRNKDGEKITRAYKIDRSKIKVNDEVNLLNVNDEVNLLNLFNKTKNNSNNNSNSNINNSNINSNINPISFNIFQTPSYQYKGTFFEDKEGNYNIRRTYEMIELDRDKVPYKEGSEELNRLAKIWNKHTNAYRNMNRIYSWFHQIHGEEREFFMINGSNLREAFDVPACNFCILAKLLEKTNCDKDELRKFQNIIKNEYIYGNIAKYLNLDIEDKAIKKAIKQSCQHWLNIRKCKLHTGSWNDEYFNGIDTYFKSELPSIYEELINWREEKHNGKISKMLWYDFQEVEYDIISNKICNYLYKKYNVTPITVHDAIYITDEDRKKIKEKIEDIFWQELDLKYLN